MMIRRMSLVISAGMLLCMIAYLVVEGFPLPMRDGRMFYEWRRGERGWGYWSPVTWSDDCGNYVIMGYSRNLVAIGPGEGIADWQTSISKVVFFEGKSNQVQFADARNQVFVFDSNAQTFQQAIPPGTAERLRSILARTHGIEMRRRFQGELPSIYETMAAWSDGPKE